ncbi:GNAT family N-acetyltransferase [Micromonospora echinospora]|uniref:GNAT family N-acetyltransferase n=1 Tax=Micromonospora echinospora TaxID=1877 RepID=UPI003A8BD3CB
MQVTVRSESWDGVDGVRLRAAQRAELDARYGNDDHEPGVAPTAGDIDVFLIARDAHGTALGCGGLRTLGPDSAEIKRMYVEPAARGTGVAVAILHSLEHEARGRGVVNLLLETGTAQPDAMRFYEREGYHRIGNFGPYEGESLSVCYARRLR